MLLHAHFWGHVGRSVLWQIQDHLLDFTRLRSGAYPQDFGCCHASWFTSSVIFIIVTNCIVFYAFHANQFFREFSLIGLLLIAIGTGGIKPCVSAFGGDQFKLPEQERQLQTFFSVFYFSINAGSLISTFITPIFRYFFFKAQLFVGAI